MTKLLFKNRGCGVDDDASTEKQAFDNAYETASDSDRFDDDVGHLEDRIPENADIDSHETDKRMKMEGYARFCEMYGIHLTKEEFNYSNSDIDSGGDDDIADWAWASKAALDSAMTQVEMIPCFQSSTSSLKARKCNLESIPRCCFVVYEDEGSTGVALTKDGKPIIQLFLAMLDHKEDSGASLEVYVTAIALYLERKARGIRLDGSTNNGFVIMIDIRRGTGWPNNNDVFNMVSLINLLAHVINNFHPGKFTLLVYPVPLFFVCVLTLLKGWVPAAAALSKDRVILIKGSDGMNDPPPKKELTSYIDDELIATMEQRRRSNFIRLCVVKRV